MSRWFVARILFLAWVAGHLLAGPLWRLGLLLLLHAAIFVVIEPRRGAAAARARLRRTNHSGG